MTILTDISMREPAALGLVKGICAALKRLEETYKKTLKFQTCF